MLRKLFLGLAIITLVSLPLLTQAADFRTGSDQELTVGETEVVKDLYLADQDVTVNADVKGDLVVAGGSLLLNGTVENSLFAVGSDITSRSNVNHTARIAGNNITISGGNILGDLLIAGNNITIGRDTVIGGDLLVGGNKVTVDGTVKGLARLAGTNITLNGTINEPIVYSQTLKIGSTAIIAKDVTYHGQNEAKVDTGAKLGGLIKFTKVTNQRTGVIPGLLTVWSMILVLLGTILLALLVTKLAPNFLLEFSNTVFTNSLVNIGYGLVVILLVPICALILAITMIGLPFAGLALAFLVPILALGTLLGKIALGSWILKVFHQQENYHPTYLGAVVGVLAVCVLGFIPVLGFLVIAFLYLISWGNLLGYCLQAFKRQTS